jgi:hypothetical protein
LDFRTPTVDTLLGSRQETAGDAFVFYGQVQVEDLKVVESPHLLMRRWNRVEAETSVVGGGVRHAVKTSNSLFEEFMRLTGPSY